MEDFSKVFAKRLNQLGIKKQVNASLICENFNRSVEQVFGEEGKKNVKAISYKSGTLKVAVTSSVWASEINLSELKVKDKRLKLRFVVGEIN